MRLLLMALLTVAVYADLGFEIQPGRATPGKHGTSEVAAGNPKGQTFTTGAKGMLSGLTLQVSAVTAVKDLSVSVYKAPKAVPMGKPLLWANGILPQELKVGDALAIRFPVPLSLPAGSYVLVLETEASKLRFRLAHGRYAEGELIRHNAKQEWVTGAKNGDLDFYLHGDQLPTLSAVAQSPPRPASPLNSVVSTNVTPLCDRLPARPNIVTVMVDDLGWNQISVKQSTMGSAKPEFATPNLEKLANEGLSFTHAYSQPNCAPTRAAMLSGQYPARIHNDVYVVGSLNRNGGSGISRKDAKFLGPEQHTHVAAAAITVAEALRENGYATAHIGKFHVGEGETEPEKVGFDINIGGSRQGHQSTCFASKSGDAWAFRGLGRGDFDRFAAPYDAMYVQKHGFPESLIGSAKHVSDALGDAMEETVGELHASGKPFYLQLHPYAVHGPVKARPDLQAKHGGHLPGFVASIDLIIGRLLAAIADPNGDGDDADSIAANTLILFTSDNGGTHGDNLPLRGKKGMFTEGGVRVPLIAYWPGVIPPNTITRHMVHSVDYYPTYLELAGKRWMPAAAEHPLDGESFADVLRKPDIARERGPIFYLFPGYMDSRAQPCVVTIDQVGDQRYKLLYFYEADAWQLYNLDADTSEVRNLISDKPELGAALSRKIRAWLSQEHVTWKPKYPLHKADQRSAGPPPLL
jgi:arylsulfatase A-like enzyme